MDSTFDSDYCVVCLEVGLLYFFTPCLHKCICEACAVNYNKQNDDNFNVCPICRRGYLSIEFDESKFADQKHDEGNAEEVENKTQQLWATFESSLQELMLSVDRLNREPTDEGNLQSNQTDTQDQLNSAVRQIQGLSLTSTETNVQHEEQSRLQPQPRFLQWLTELDTAGPLRSQQILEAIDGIGPSWGRTNRAARIESNLNEDYVAIEDINSEVAVPLTASTGAIPRTRGRQTSTSLESLDLSPRRLEETDDLTGSPRSCIRTIRNLRLPITVIVREVISANFHNEGSTRLCTATLNGTISIHYPINIFFILDVNLNRRPLNFQLHNSDRLCDIERKTNLCHVVFTGEGLYCTIELHELLELLPKLVKKEPYASFLTTTLMSYSIKSSTLLKDIDICPLSLSTNWIVHKTTTDLIIKYRYTSVAKASQTILQDVQITVHMNAGFDNFEAEPMARREANKLIWKLPNLPSEDEDNNTYYYLNVKFHFTQPLIYHPMRCLKANRKGKVSVEFLGNGNTLSGIDFQLHNTPYTIRDVKKLFQSGKYICDGIVHT